MQTDIEYMFLKNYSSFSKVSKVDSKLNVVHGLLLAILLPTKMCYKKIRHSKTLVW